MKSELTPDKIGTRQNLDILWACIGFSVFLIANIFSFFRLELFNMPSHGASTNFAFNVSIFFPMTLLSIFIGLFIISRIIAHWKVRTNLKKKWFAITIALLVPSFVFY